MSKVKYFHVFGKTTTDDGQEHVITVVGKFEQTRERKLVYEKVPVEVKEGSIVEGVLAYPSNKLLNRKLTLGLSICHPSDEFDEEIGVEIAKKRIEEGVNLGSIETSNVTMLTEDAIMAELFVKLNHIIDNVEEYIGYDD